ncbi:MAG: HAMP domain-containing protein [Ardenticatenaceae bacterium]|nr:HAMP domain-containing protein [Ardenticatenaceae bacterium]MCB9443220.1 HAMP domain-containing protein [Ardenticatenaceae bacterium]
MNRLWVRLSFIITGVILMMVFLPFLLQLVLRNGLLPLPQPEMPAEVRRILETLPPETIANFRVFVQQELMALFTRGIITAAIIGVVAGAWLSHTLAAPLQRLEKGAQAVAAKDLSYRVPVRGSQEIQAVAQSFNQMAGQLETAETLRQNLLADVAHELRHPVHVLKGNLQAILDDVYPLDKEEIARLVDQTNHLQTLINDLHELAQAEAQQLPMHKQAADIAQLVKDVTAVFKPAAAAKQIDLHVELLGAMPILEVDASRMRQVLHNLLDNALRHTPENGRILITVQQTEVGLQIRVTDSGIGIKPEDLPHVFDRFYRSDSSRSRENGSTGLGLAIVRAITEAHGGHIDVASAGPGQGSIFTLVFPQEIVRK